MADQPQTNGAARMSPGMVRNPMQMVQEFNALKSRMLRLESFLGILGTEIDADGLAPKIRETVSKHRESKQRQEHPDKK